MPNTRRDKLDRIAADGGFDAIVVGGGINGIGVFRDLALQGLRVLLVERNDYCSGCSAAPSRMIHGGLRYLENGEFGLVRESLDERDELLAAAAHLVRPLPTTVPIATVFSGIWNALVSFLGGNSRPGRRGLVPIRIGLSVYDWLTRQRRTTPRHRYRGRAETFDVWPDLDPDIRFSVTYFDAWISYPERLGVELIQDGEGESPESVALNYATVEWAESGLELVDGQGGGRVPVSARVIVNATGAWLDETKSALSRTGAAATRLVSGTKGSHLIIDNPRLLAAFGDHMLYFENADGRIMIGFPYLGRVLVGSTDIRVDKATRVRCEDDEREYLLESIGRLFPDIPIDPAEIVFTYSGIRPLPMSNHEFTGRISRGHFTRRLPGTPPQICLVGGKWTTFRAFAEQVADRVLAELGAPRRQSTVGRPIGGGRDFPSNRTELAERYRARLGVSAARANHLVSHYGTAGGRIQAHCAAYPGNRPLADGCPYTTGEIDYLAREEQVVHLADLVLRRTGLAITGQVSGDAIDAALDAAGDALNWTDREAADERASLIEELQTFHGVSAARLCRQSERSEQECA